MKKLMLIAVMALAMTFLFSGLALAYTNLSPDGTTCTPCHTDGRTGTPAKAEPAKPAPAAPAPVQKQEPKSTAPQTSSSKAAAVKLTVTNLSETKTVDGYKEGDKFLAPIRAVAELFGGKVTGWDNAKQQAAVSYGGKEVAVKAVKNVNRTAYADAAELAGSLGAGFDAAQATIKRGKSSVVRPQWEGTLHNYANLTIADDSPAMRDNCITCHDGQGFALEISKRAELPDPAKVTGIDCSTCHSDRGKSIMNSGNTPVLANGYQVNGAGYGALCITCHNGRKTPLAEAGSGAAPHRSNQSEVVFGFGGYEYPGISYPSSPHGAIPDTCVSCHMAEKDGVMSHEFKVDNASASCSSCHDGLDTINRLALSDYDGDKVIEGIQDEVKGLVHLVEVALEEALPGLEMHESHGSVYFVDANEEQVEVEDKYYYAAWNLITVENDGSLGIHNPAYVVKLLQSSYKDLTGHDIANAVIR